MAIANIHNNASLLGLDDYSLLQVFSYLSTFDQFSISNVNTRFAALISYEWSRKPMEFEIDPNKFSSDTKFDEFLSTVKTYAHTLKVVTMTEDSLAQLSKHKFPKVHNLDWNYNNDIDLKVKKSFMDENNIKFGETFPKLRTLTLRHIKSQTSVRQNDITHIHSTFLLDKFLEYMRMMYELSRPHSLTLNSINLENIMNMPYLVELFLFVKPFEQFVWHRYLQSRKRNVVRLIYTSLRDQPFNGLLYGIEGIHELEELVLQECSFCENLLTLLPRKWTNLRQVHMTNCVFKNQKAVISFIVYCPKLTVLDVTRTNINKQFIKDVVKLLTMLSEVRTQPLELWVGYTQIPAAELKTFSHKLLIINTTSRLKNYPKYYLGITFGELVIANKAF